MPLVHIIDQREYSTISHECAVSEWPLKVECSCTAISEWWDR